MSLEFGQSVPMEATVRDTAAKEAHVNLLADSDLKASQNAWRQAIPAITAAEDVAILGVNRFINTPLVTRSVHNPVMSGLLGRHVSSEVKAFPFDTGARRFTEGALAGVGVVLADRLIDHAVFNSDDRGSVTLAADLLSPLAIGLCTRWSLPVKAAAMIGTHALARTLDQVTTRNSL